MSFKYSYNTIVYSGEEYLQQIKRLSKYGYEGIELVGEPDWYDFKEVNKINNDHGIKVNSICSIFTQERDLINPDESLRQKAIDYCKTQKTTIAGIIGRDGGYVKKIQILQL